MLNTKEIDSIAQYLEDNKKWVTVGMEEYQALLNSVKTMKALVGALPSARGRIQLTQPAKEAYNTLSKDICDQYDAYIRLAGNEELNNIKDGIVPVSEEKSFYSTFKDQMDSTIKAVANSAVQTKINWNSDIYAGKKTEAEPRASVNYLAAINTNLKFTNLSAADRLKMEKFLRDINEIKSLEHKLLNESRNNDSDTVTSLKSIAQLERRVSREMRDFAVLTAQNDQQRLRYRTNENQIKEYRDAKMFLRTAVPALEAKFIADAEKIDRITGNTVKEIPEDRDFLADEDIKDLKKLKPEPQKEIFNLDNDDLDLSVDPNAREDIKIEGNHDFFDDELAEEFPEEDKLVSDRKREFKEMPDKVKEARKIQREKTNKLVKAIDQEINKNPVEKYTGRGPLTSMKKELLADQSEPYYVENIPKLSEDEILEVEKNTGAEPMQLFTDEQKAETKLERYDRELFGINNIKTDMIDMLKMGNRHVFNGTKRYDTIIELAEQLDRDRKALEQYEKEQLAGNGKEPVQQENDPKRREYVRKMLLTEKKLSNLMKEYIGIKQDEIDRDIAAGKKPNFNSERRMNLVKNVAENFKVFRNRDFEKYAKDVIEISKDVQSRRMTDPQIAVSFEKYKEEVVAKTVYEKLSEDAKNGEKLNEKIHPVNLNREAENLSRLLEETNFGKNITRNLRADFVNRSNVSLRVNENYDNVIGEAPEERTADELKKDLEGNSKEMIKTIYEMDNLRDGMNGLKKDLADYKELENKKLEAAGEMIERGNWPSKKYLRDKKGNWLKDYVPDGMGGYEEYRIPDVWEPEEKNAIRQKQQELEQKKQELEKLEKNFKKLTDTRDNLIKYGTFLGYADILQNKEYEIETTGTIVDKCLKTIKSYENPERKTNGPDTVKGRNQNQAEGNKKLFDSIIEDSSSMNESENSSINNDIKPIGFRKPVGRMNKK